MIEAFFTNPYAVLGAVLLACFVGYVAWRNNFKSRRAAACNAFRSAVLAELGSIYPHASAWPVNIDGFLRSHFAALQAAVENFKPFVPLWRRWLFERAWLRYCCSTGRKCDKNTYHHYMPIHSSGEQPSDVKAIFHNNVSKLLLFANET